MSRRTSAGRSVDTGRSKVRARSALIAKSCVQRPSERAWATSWARSSGIRRRQAGDERADLDLRLAGDVGEDQGLVVSFVDVLLRHRGEDRRRRHVADLGIDGAETADGAMTISSAARAMRVPRSWRSEGRTP